LGQKIAVFGSILALVINKNHFSDKQKQVLGLLISQKPSKNKLFDDADQNRNQKPWFRFISVSAENRDFGSVSVTVTNTNSVA